MNASSLSDTQNNLVRAINWCAASGIKALCTYAGERSIPENLVHIKQHRSCRPSCARWGGLSRRLFALCSRLGAPQCLVEPPLRFRSLWASGWADLARGQRPRMPKLRLQFVVGNDRDDDAPHSNYWLMLVLSALDPAMPRGCCFLWTTSATARFAFF